MSPALDLGIDLKGLGLKGMFRPDGFPYFMVPEEIAQLPSYWRTAAMEVWTILVKYVHEWGELDDRLITRRIAEEIESSPRKIDGEIIPRHRCESFVLKGLYALQEKAKVITRVRKHGRRFIVFLGGLLGQERPAPVPKGERPSSSPSTPSEDLRNTSTRGGSSSSLGSVREGEEKPGEVPSAELVARACELIPEATPDWVAAMVAVYTSEWFGRALDQVEERNRKPHSNPVRKRKFVMDILAGWTKEGGPPRKLELPAAPPAAPRRTPAEPEPAHQLTAEELAELIGPARAPSGEWARRAIRTALRDGGIAPDLAATIPPELLALE